MKELHAKEEKPEKEPSKKGKFAKFFAKNKGLIAGMAIFFGPCYAATGYEVYKHESYDSRANRAAAIAMKSDAREEEMMDTLSVLAFGRQNAEDLLSKIDDIAKAGPLRGFHPEQPHQGLWLLLQGYQGKSSLTTLTCLIPAIGPGGHLGSAPNSQERIADLYYAGKLDSLIEKHRQR
ncbi:MAG: hypothetical protein AB1324_04040 [Candidatus Micrarchaeota archaeon]